MKQSYTELGYIILEFEPDISMGERRLIAEDVVSLGNGNVQAVEFFKDRYKAAARFETPDEHKLNELVDYIGKIRGVKKDSLYVRHMLACKPYILFKNLEQLIVVNEK